MPDPVQILKAQAAAAFMALKFVLHIHFSYFGWGFYLGVVLAAALVYLAGQPSLRGIFLPEFFIKCFP